VHRFSDAATGRNQAPSGVASVTHFFHLDDLNRQRVSNGKLYLEFLRVPAMSAGVYVLPKGGSDPQKPHREDEMYYVVRGRARMQIMDEHAEVGAGSVIFVEAEADHRFYDIKEELEVLVFFAPAEQE
jgi:quercetin dioxygenase-like cupin family protein